MLVFLFFPLSRSYFCSSRYLFIYFLSSPQWCAFGMKECVLPNWICSSPFMLNVKSILVKSHFYKQCRTVLAWTVYQAGLVQGELWVRCAVTNCYITPCFVFYPKLRRRKTRTLAPPKVTLGLRWMSEMETDCIRTRPGRVNHHTRVFLSRPHQTTCQYLSINNCKHIYFL